MKKLILLVLALSLCFLISCKEENKPINELENIEAPKIEEPITEPEIEEPIVVETPIEPEVAEPEVEEPKAEEPVEEPGLMTIADAGVPLVEIPDEEVPLAEVPATGDESIVLVMISLMSLAGIILLGKKRCIA